VHVKLSFNFLNILSVLFDMAKNKNDKRLLARRTRQNPAGYRPRGQRFSSIFRRGLVVQTKGHKRDRHRADGNQQQQAI